LTIGYADTVCVGKLSIEYATDVVWDEHVFDMLTIPQDDKKLLSALLLDNKASRDVVAGRGAGIVILFYGGRGTGKTFAAEALAELARKPLYPLIPYEVGIEPNQVENNIKEAFYLGGIWDAVIILEDCDIFIGLDRKPTLAEKSRASIILQAIDNYPGVVVLTMMRHGVSLFHEDLQHRVRGAVLFKPR
jgi:hypothetical protein